MILGGLEKSSSPLQSAGGSSQTTVGTRHTEEAAPPAFAREDLLAARFRVSRVLPYQQASPPFISNLSLAIFSGLLLVFAFPDWGLWSLGWVGTAPLIMAVVREQRFWRSVLLGYVTGTLFYIGSSHWVTHTMNVYGGIPLWLSYLILLVFASVLGIFTGLFAGVLALVIKRFGGWAILCAPAVWAASEWARINLVGVGWNALGYSQAFQPTIIQIARWGGVYAVSALMVAASTALVFALVYLERRRGIIVLTAAGVLAIAAVLYGQAVRGQGDDERGSVAITAIQPNIPIEGAWDDPKFVEQMTLRHISLSEQAIASVSREAYGLAAAPEDGARMAGNAAGVKLVVWPESPMNFEYDRDGELRRRLADFTRRNGVYLLMNSWGFPENLDTHQGAYNSAMLIAPSGEKIFQYDKIALVPFGEYVPAREWLPFMDRVPALVYDLTPGTSFTLSDVAGAKIGTLICFEATRPDIARRMRQMGASALVQISNELWYNSAAAARQMLAQAVFRAVENNVDVIRATNSGLSARIDGSGAVQDETPMFETATRLWEIKTVDEAQATGPTFYTRYGDLFVIFCAAISAMLVAATFAPEKWGRKDEKDD
jgi:apolipoprotein N-acyltransferase